MAGTVPDSTGADIAGVAVLAGSESGKAGATETGKADATAIGTAAEIVIEIAGEIAAETEIAVEIAAIAADQTWQAEDAENSAGLFKRACEHRGGRCNLHLRRSVRL